MLNPANEGVAVSYDYFLASPWGTFCIAALSRHTLTFEVVTGEWGILNVEGFAVRRNL